MTDTTYAKEQDLFLRYGITVEPDWLIPTMYQATLNQGWIHSTATAGTPNEAIDKLKEHIVSETTWLNSDLTLDEAFEQYMMYKKLGV
jgi:hypothetical protein